MIIECCTVSCLQVSLIVTAYDVTETLTFMSVFIIVIPRRALLDGETTVWMMPDLSTAVTQQRTIKYKGNGGYIEYSCFHFYIFSYTKHYYA